MTLAMSLPVNTNEVKRVHLEWGDRQMVVRVTVDTQAEFDRWMGISQRPARSRMERIIVIRNGVEYHL